MFGKHINLGWQKKTDYRFIINVIIKFYLIGRALRSNQFSINVTLNFTFLLSDQFKSGQP